MADVNERSFGFSPGHSNWIWWVIIAIIVFCLLCPGGFRSDYGYRD